MNRFVPYDKLSKKGRKAQDALRRGKWELNPVTRRPANPKAYDRNREKRRTGSESE